MLHLKILGKYTKTMETGDFNLLLVVIALKIWLKYISPKGNIFHEIGSIRKHVYDVNHSHFLQLPSITMSSNVSLQMGDLA